MKLIEQVVEALSTIKVKATPHVDDIARAIVSKYPNIPVAPENLSRKISALLARDIQRRKGDSLFSKPKNKVISTLSVRKGFAL